MSPSLADACEVELFSVHGGPTVRGAVGGIASTPRENLTVLAIGLPGLPLGRLAVRWREAGEASSASERSIAEALCRMTALAMVGLRRGEEAEQATRRAEREEALAAAAQQRLELHDGISALVVGSLDGDALLEGLGRVVVPVLGDWVGFWLAASGVEGRWHSAQGTSATLLRELHAVFGFDPIARVRHVVETGEPALCNAPPRAEDDRGPRAESALVVRLAARGRVAGAMVLLSYEPSRRYGAPELAAVEDLAVRVALSLDNARLYREAQDAVRVRDEFLSVASHELNTPLSALRLNVQSLARGVVRGSLDRATTLARAKSAERQADRLTRLIEKLLDISRITGGKLVLQLETMDLAAVIGEVMARVLDEIRGEVLVHFSTEGDLVGSCDRLRLDQVVTNLLSNAVKYGGGKPIEVKLRAEGTWARLTVRDHGMGIAADDQQRIFDRFERVAGHRCGGLGLGLWIVRQILDALGGEIGVESAPGGGSTFTVLLPLEPAGTPSRR